jgi:hypothetical protein
MKRSTSTMVEDAEEDPLYSSKNPRSPAAPDPVPHQLALIPILVKNLVMARLSETVIDLNPSATATFTPKLFVAMFERAPPTHMPKSTPTTSHVLLLNAAVTNVSIPISMRQ